jgi:segregation and condensation protein B
MTMNGEPRSAGEAFWAARGVRIEPEPEHEDGIEDSTEAEGGAEFEVEAEAPALQEPEAADSELDEPDSNESVLEPASELESGAVVIPAQAQASLDEVEPQSGDVVDGLAALNESLAESRRAREDAPRPEPTWQLAGDLADPLPPLKTCLEAILMVVDEPVTDVVLAQVVERPKGEVAEALRELAEEYTAQGRGFELREVGVSDGPGGQTGWRMYSRVECAPVVERFVRDGQQAKLTQAALETLAVVAYRQPVSRSKVSAIRGVNCDGVMRTLLARGLVEECGTEHETGALLYRTTGYFLERMGLKGLDELPDLAPLLPSAAEVEDEA